jgi:hypothetical protein
MRQLTKEQAIKFFESGVWKTWTDEEIVKFQLFQTRLCMDFSRFHEAMEKILNRPIFSHEFAYADVLKKEYLNSKEAPTFGEILELLPMEEKRIIFFNNE